MTENETKTEFKALRKALEQENGNNLNHVLSDLGNTSEYIKTPQESLKWTCTTFLNKRDSYKGTLEEQKQKIITALKRIYAKRLNAELEQLRTIEQAPDTVKEFYITVEWKRSQMWGMNPTATDDDGNTSGSIGGCGYCKHSTATARVLNQHNEILKRLYKVKDEYLSTLSEEDLKNVEHNDTHRNILSYGSGYGVLPRFEGGVGVNCHQTILSKVGLKMEHVSNTKTADVYRVYEVEE